MTPLTLAIIFCLYCAKGRANCLNRGSHELITVYNRGNRQGKSRVKKEG